MSTLESKPASLPALNRESVLIQDGKIAVNTWIHLDDEQVIPASGDVTVTIDRFRKEGSFLIERADKVGIRVVPATLVDELAPFLPKVAMVVFQLTTFMDGRYFTTARLLRERLAYHGEIRVVGAVTPDQIFYMRRCGINGFELASGHRPEVALAALSTFSQVYQAAVDQPLPFYRR